MLNGKKVIAFICECNPFHEGHKRLINSAKSEGDILIAIMSGNFVQRGEPAVYDKYKRASILIKNGVSIVIELPVEYSLSSAKYFACAAIKILNKLNFVDKLIFGCSIPDINILSKFATININSGKNSTIKNALKNGETYSSALSTLYNKNLSSNDILAVEYISAIKNTNSKIVPICIKRINDIPTASEIRKTIDNKITNNTFSDILNYKLILAKNSILDIQNSYLMTNEIYNSLMKLPQKKLSFDEIASSLKTKNRTLANIKRCLLNLVLCIDKNIVALNTFPKSIRIIGIKKSFVKELKNIKLPYLLSFSTSSYKSFIKNFPNSKEIKIKNGEFIISPQILLNINASDLYNLYIGNNKLEATTKVLVL